MKISIIIPTYNSEKTINDTLESIKNQTYKDVEVVVIDGLSKDKTLEIVKGFSDKINIKIISEKDDGLYDAMNKGIKIASGDIVHILNSDDYYSENDVLEKINKAFIENANVEIVYGDIKYFDKDKTEKIVRVWKAGEYQEKKLNSGWIIPHPSLFIKNDLYKRLDHVFDTQLKISADYEFILRLLKVYKIKPLYIPEILVSMRIGGVSDGNLSSKIKGWQELRKSWSINKISVPKFFIIRRLFGKITDFKL